jgi:hypothetical protein
VQFPTRHIAISAWHTVISFMAFGPINRTGHAAERAAENLTYPQGIESFRCTAIFQQLVNALEQINVSAERLVRSKNLAISLLKRRKS